MQLDEKPGDRQAESALAVGPLYLVVGLEDALQLLLRDAAAGIADAGHQLALVMLPGGDGYLPVERGKLRGVGNQRQQQLFEVPAVCQHRRKRIRYLKRQALTPALDAGVDAGRYIADHLVNRYRIGIELEVADLRPGNFGEVGHFLIEAMSVADDGLDELPLRTAFDRVEFVSHQFRRSDDGGQRCLQFMSDRRDEIYLFVILFTHVARRRMDSFRIAGVPVGVPPGRRGASPGVSARLPGDVAGDAAQNGQDSDDGALHFHRFLAEHPGHVRVELPVAKAGDGLGYAVRLW